jgi:sugar lactone lactonase YvrE
MYATTSTATTHRNSGARRAESSFNYIRTGIRTVIAATAIAFAAAGTALAGQALWVANGANVVEFAQLPGGKHDEKPKVQLNSAVFGAPQGVVFDAANNLWVIDGGNGGTIAPSLEEFTEAQLMNLKKNPTPTPNVQITSGDLVFPQQAVFDASGNMWLSDNGAGKVFVITPAQLAAGGNIAFTTTIESDPMFNGPLGIVLHGGNLYIANNADTTIFEFNAGHLPAIGSGLHVLVPDVILSDDGMGSIQGPWALVFDQAGDLWSSNANSPNTLVKFGPTQISSTGAPTPQTTINPFNEMVGGKARFETLVAPNGIAFDQKGNLVAISSAAPFGVSRYDAKEQAAGGTIKPASFLVGAQTTLNAPAGDNFGPDINH